MDGPPSENGKKTARDQRGRFGPGNKASQGRGRPRGRTAMSLLAERLGKDNVDAIVDKAKAMVLGAEKPNAAVLVGLLRLLFPSPKEISVAAHIELPPLVNAESALAAIREIAAATARGDLDQEQSRALTGLIDTFLKTLSTVDLEARLHALEVSALAQTIGDRR
jgi:hypothetical protein